MQLKKVIALHAFQLFAFVFLSVFNSALAFTLNNTVAAAFSQNEVKVNVSNQTCQNLGINNQQLLDLAGEAINQYWNRAPHSRLRLKQGSIVSTSSSFYTEAGCSNTSGACTPNTALTVSSDILISCNDDSGPGVNFGAGVLGVSIPNNIQGKNLVGALILINDKSDTTFPNKARDEQIAILAHEIGHGIGLGHSPVEDSLMYFASIPTRRSLGWDDLDGLAYLYPVQQPFSGCGQITEVRPQGPSGNLWALALTFIAGALLAQIIRPRFFRH